jgi:cephalosporin hydroxylase
MKLTIDTTEQTVTREQNGQVQTVPLYTPEAFRWLSREWVRVGWDQKYTYTFTWLGRPVIQFPEDMLRTQEVIYRLRPDVIVETGVAHGGSLVFYASLCQLLGTGRIVGVDVEIRPPNRRAVEAHPLAPLISLVEGDSVAPGTLDRIRALIRPGETVLVILDSCHTRAHVLAELRAYAPLVTPGSYVIVQDGVMADLMDVPRGKPEWADDNPVSAVSDFLADHPEFTQEAPPWQFNESPLRDPVTYSPGGWLRRRPD